MKNSIFLILFLFIIFFTYSQETKEKSDKSVEELPVAGQILSNYDPTIFTEIDRHALSVPNSALDSVEDLAEYLIKPAENDLEKVRSIFRWITDNIAYDTNAYFSGRYGDMSAGGVLKSGKSICSGYSALFQSLCDIAEIEAVTFSGYAKKYYYKPSHVYSKTTHAWNAVKLEGEWYLIDSTWGAGSLNGRNFIKRYKDFWFLTPPKAAIFSHLPEDPKWQLLEKPINMERFREIPYLSDYFYAMGFSLEDVYTHLNSDTYRGFPEVYPQKVVIDIVEGPVSKYLSSKESYSFEFKIDEASDIMIINNGKRTYFNKIDDLWTGIVSPVKGPLGFYYKGNGSDTQYWNMLNYVVK